MVTETGPTTLQQAIRYYSDLDVCQKALVEARWPDGVTCPHCGSQDVGYLANQRRWQCRGKHPRRQFSAKVGSIFEDSPITLDKWFVAIWLIDNAKNGISSYEISRAIGVTQKTAWFMLHRIRLAMQTKSFEKFGGEVEADETYIGGSARNMHANKRSARKVTRGRSVAGKTAVMALLNRHGKDGTSQVRTEVLSSLRRDHVQGHVRKHVAAGSNVHTDNFASYVGLNGEYVHNVVNHAEEYVRGNVHTNGCENFWSLLKRAIKGTYVSVEPFHLFRYLDEQAFRFNNRKGTDADRFEDTLRRVTGKRLTYRSLIGATDEPAEAV